MVHVEIDPHVVAKELKRVQERQTRFDSRISQSDRVEILKEKYVTGELTLLQLEDELMSVLEC